MCAIYYQESSADEPSSRAEGEAETESPDTDSKEEAGRVLVEDLRDWDRHLYTVDTMNPAGN